MEKENHEILTKILERVKITDPHEPSCSLLVDCLICRSLCLSLFSKRARWKLHFHGHIETLVHKNPEIIPTD